MREDELLLYTVLVVVSFGFTFAVLYSLTVNNSFFYLALSNITETFITYQPYINETTVLVLTLLTVAIITLIVYLFGKKKVKRRIRL